MIHRVLGIGRWVVDFLFSTGGYDEDGVLACLYSVGAPRNVMQRASEIMDDARPNCGFTFCNPESRSAVVVIGPTTSGRQFQNTFTHELRHLADGIAKSLGIDLDAERPAYLTGDAAMALSEIVCRLGCDRCRH